MWCDDDARTALRSAMFNERLRERYETLTEPKVQGVVFWRGVRLSDEDEA